MSSQQAYAIVAAVVVALRAQGVAESRLPAVVRVLEDALDPFWR